MSILHRFWDIASGVTPSEFAELFGVRKLESLLQQVDISDIPVLSFTLRVVQSTRDLGVILDSHLSLSAHIAVLCRAGFYQLRQIRPAISGYSHLTLPGLLFRRSSPVIWTGVTRCCMVCWRTCWGRCSQCRMLPLVSLPPHADVTTSLLCCVSYTGCRSRDEWNLRWHVLYTSR